MKETILIVGSGASGVHFALTVLKKGFNVTMLDVGHPKPEVVNPNDSLNALKRNLNDPASYFLGNDYRGVFFPSTGGEYYGTPPNKDYVFSGVDNFNYQAQGFAPLMSFARGGLAEAWTGGVYPFNDDDLQDFPFGYRELKPYYEEVAQRIGVCGEQDDLARLMPVHDHLLTPLKLDAHSELLLQKYKNKRAGLNQKQGFYMGRSRLAVLSRDKNGRKACDYLGRCLWGCPTESFYTPSLTLRECQSYSNFRYIPNVFVTHFRLNRKSEIESVAAESPQKSTSHNFKADKVVLAAGTLASANILLKTIYHHTGEIVKLRGLMDNRQILVPFVNLSMIGQNFDPNTYQYHQLAVGIAAEDPEHNVHAQITTLKTALVHPIIQKIPFDFKTSLFLFRHLHAALGLLNVNFSDHRRSTNYLTLNEQDLKLVIHYTPPESEPLRIKQGLKKLRAGLLKLGCIALPGMAHTRPMGASVHYAGTVPMSSNKNTLTCSNFCQSHDFDNLFFADGSSFPFLPAKNLTFTLMANATRIADSVFK